MSWYHLHGSPHILLTAQLPSDICRQGKECSHTRPLQAEKFEQRYLLNPGSATGVYSSITRNPKPSFLLMDIDGPKVCDSKGCLQPCLMPLLQGPRLVPEEDIDGHC